MDFTVWPFVHYWYENGRYNPSYAAAGMFILLIFGCLYVTVVVAVLRKRLWRIECQSVGCADLAYYEGEGE